MYDSYFRKQSVLTLHYTWIFLNTLLDVENRVAKTFFFCHTDISHMFAGPLSPGEESKDYSEFCHFNCNLTLWDMRMQIQLIVWLSIILWNKFYLNLKFKKNLTLIIQKLIVHTLIIDSDRWNTDSENILFNTLIIGTLGTQIKEKLK